VITTERIWDGCYGSLDEKLLQNLIGDGIWIHCESTAWYGGIGRPEDAIRLQRECPICGVQFSVPRGRGHVNRKHCSPRCVRRADSQSNLRRYHARKKAESGSGSSAQPPTGR
jgi:hypothetical protein